MKNELISGTEPYLVKAYRDGVVKGISMPDMNVLESDQFTVAERDFARQAPFLDERRVLILQFDKLSVNELLEIYLKEPSAKTDLFIFVKEIDKRTSLYKKFPKKDIKQFDKDMDVLKRWILGYLKKQGCRITEQAYAELTARINYELEDVNLYHVRSALKKLCSISEDITPELVKRMIPLNEKEDVFRLIELIDKKETIELFHQADIMLQNGEQNVIGTLSLLLRSYRILYKVSVGGCSLKDAGVYYRTYVPRLSGEQAQKGMDTIQEIINGIKNGKYMQDFALRFCLSKLCQI